MALRHLQLAVEDDPEDEIALMALGNCLLRLGRADEASGHFEQLLALNDQLAGAHHNLGICRFMLGDFEAGVASCREALRIEPDNVILMHKLVLAYIHEGRWADAADMRRQAVATDPEYPPLAKLPRTFIRFRLAHLTRRCREAARYLLG